ncbi:MAG: VOC family protein [Alphaproteobacteria bacterium]
MDLNLGRLAQIGFNVADLDRAEKFYAEVLGLRHLGRVRDFMTFFDCGGVTLLLSKAKPDKVTSDGVLYLSCGDIGLCTRELEARGVKFVEAPHVISRQDAFDLWMAFFNDLDGHMLALHCQAPKGYQPS